MALVLRVLVAIAITIFGCHGFTHAQEFTLEIDHYVVEPSRELVAAVNKRPPDARDIRKRLRERERSIHHIAVSGRISVGERFEFEEAKRSRELLVKGEIIRVRDSSYLDLKVVARAMGEDRALGPTLEFKPELNQILGTFESSRIVDGVSRTELHLFLARVSPVR